MVLRLLEGSQFTDQRVKYPNADNIFLSLDLFFAYEKKDLSIARILTLEETCPSYIQLKPMEL